MVQTQRFPEQVHHFETSQMFLRAVGGSASLGFEPGDINVRRYVGNGATNGVDRNGLEDKEEYKPRDPKTLTFANDYPKALKKKDFDAFTAVKYVDKSEIVVTVAKKGDKFEATAKVVKVKIYADFDKGGSYVLAVAGRGFDLIEHERLHLQIAQSVTNIYSERIRILPITEDGDTEKDSSNRAIDAVRKRIVDVDFVILKSINQKISDLYDSATGGALKQDQQKVWKEKHLLFIEDYLRKEHKNTRLDPDSKRD